VPTLAARVGRHRGAAGCARRPDGRGGMTRAPLAGPARWLSVMAGTLLLSADPAGAVMVKGTVVFRGGAFPAEVAATDGVVVLHGPPAKAAAGRATIDQRGRRFIPRVLAVAPGTTVEFPNNDTVHHNVRSASAAERFDLGLYAPGETRSTVFARPGVVEIRCSAHPEMEAYVMVSDSPHFAQVTAGGIYRIEDVPPGRYEVEAWHPDLESVRRPLTVPPDVSVLTVDLDFRERRRGP
jgi:plastocyanin